MDERERSKASRKIRTEVDRRIEAKLTAYRAQRESRMVGDANALDRAIAVLSVGESAARARMRAQLGAALDVRAAASGMLIVDTDFSENGVLVDKHHGPDAHVST